ncbi:hypothetical protein ACQCSX_22505 (plasmid) [Pseudarthrobacter sp. P1]|uniref:hypothetical protein n=1 Tax=Pseudarthrobacter sp. P1 TaxID=3418418 RepID=UPI003CE7816F
MRTFFGYVKAPERMFSTGPCGEVVFAPINNAYGTIHPMTAPGRGDFDCILVLEDGEFFQVLEELDKSEGRQRSSPAGNFLHYPDAYRAAHGLGVQGGIARIVIKSPAGLNEITAMDADGSMAVMETSTLWGTTYLERRAQFPSRNPSPHGDV